MNSNKNKRYKARQIFEDILRQDSELYNTEAELEELAKKCINAVIILETCLEEHFGPESEDCYLED